MTDQEKYLMAIQLSDASVRVSMVNPELCNRLAELALELLREKDK